jgi:hypothetical protein
VCACVRACVQESSVDIQTNTLKPVLSQHNCPALVLFPSNILATLSSQDLLFLFLNCLTCVIWGRGCMCMCVCVCVFNSLFKVYVLPFSVASIIYHWIRGWLVYCELERMCREAVVTWCVVLFWNLCGKQERDLKPVIIATLWAYIWA